MKWLIVIILIITSFSLRLGDQINVYADDFEWNISTPEDMGLGADSFEPLEADWQENFRSVTGLVVVYQDTIIYEDYHNRQSQNSLMSVFSVTKSIGSMLTGIAIEEGLITDVDEPISTYFPSYYTEIDNPDTEAITIENVLTMTTGLRSGWNSEGSPINAYRDDLFTKALNLFQTSEPSTTSKYNTIVSNLMSGILSEAVNKDLEEYAEAVLFTPLGIDSWRWYRDDKGYPTIGAGLELSTRDMAKIGRLMLRGGDWDGEQIIPADWVEISTQAHYDSDIWTGETAGYGYLWWVSQDIDYDNFLALGYGGQFIYVIPEFDLVVAISSQCCADPTTGWNVRKIVDDYIIPMLEKNT